MRLFIAEKPSLAKAIASQLPLPQSGNNATGFIKCANGDVVTWCFGHILEAAMPDAYGTQYGIDKFPGVFADLPLVPEVWKILPKESSKKQLAVIKDLVKQATTIVNAGDPDREGQMLIDEVLEHFGNKKPVERIWLAAQDPASVQKALATMKPNTEYHNLYMEAIARSRADWLVGMNLSRAYTIAARTGGRGPTVSVGRVQTPTLNLVVQRDLEIANFKPKDYFLVNVSVKVANGSFSAGWKAPEGYAGLDSEGRLTDESVANAIKARVAGVAKGVISSAQVTDERTPPPMPFALSTLQIYANRRFGFGAQQVLDICQALYDAQLTSYPRTDCEFLPESQHGDSGKIMGHLGKHFASAAGATGSLKSRAWNDKKITAHHAIIPTGKAANLANLSPSEKIIYEAISLRYVEQFYPDYKFQKAIIETTFGADTFRATGSTPVSTGWKAVQGTTEDDENDKEAKLPKVTKGEAAQATNVSIAKKKTTPPDYYTEGTLIKAMTNIHQFVTDPEMKKRLKEVAGIGTEATRANIFEGLFKRGFMEKTGSGKKVKIVSTEAGRALATALPNSIKDPGMTALWEGALESVGQGKLTMLDFVEKQAALVTKLVTQAQGMKLDIPYTAKSSNNSSSSGGKSYSAGAKGGKPSASASASSGKSAPAGKMTALNVPFDEKDEAKALGARWDGEKKSWGVPAGTDTKPFAKWLTKKAAPAAKMK